jgi:hypothetical protein
MMVAGAMSMGLNYVDTGTSDLAGQGRLLPQECGDYNGFTGTRHPVRRYGTRCKNNKKN